MDRAFWQQRWHEGRIGFHEGRPNLYLERYADQLAGRSRVLVPLCGKSKDLAFLASRGHQVIGAELVEDAVRAFFTEHAITPSITPHGRIVEYAAPPITLYAGDLFDLTPAQLGLIDAIYDRAALVALPDPLRRRYVDHLRVLAPSGTRILLVTFEYDQSKMAGPPFCVDEAEVGKLYAGSTIELLASQPDTRVRPDAPPAIEKCFAITL